MEQEGPDTPSTKKRSAGQWFILLLAWLVGLVVWAVYVAVIVLLLLRFL